MTELTSKSKKYRSNLLFAESSH